MVVGATSIAIGLLWDISWHESIGRDTFWTPAHMAIYLGGALPGLVCAWLVLRTTLRGASADLAVSVKIWGFRGPLGAWVTLWGAVAMVTSAPFDNWWHDAYGLDVEIISPPHSALAAGMFSVVVGAVLVVLATQNRSSDQRPAGHFLFVYAVGLYLVMAATFVTELTLPIQQHAITFYWLGCGMFPFVLVTASLASRLNWGATCGAAAYLAFLCGAVWILPLFPAQPKLAPIYNPVTHMVPPAFPLLLVVPGLAIDGIVRGIGREGGWIRSIVLAVLLAAAFVATFIFTQWNFSAFLLSPAAENWVFVGNRYWPYMDHLGEWCREFFIRDEEHLTAGRFPFLFALALVSSTAGIAAGRWMRRVRR